MGGLVRMLIREVNDEITSGLVATSTMNDMIKKTLLIHNEYLDSWIHSVIKPKLNEEGKWLTDDGYVEKEELKLKSPYQYGIVVIDLKKRKLMSYQGFSWAKSIRLYELFEIMQEEKEKMIPIFNLSLKEGVLKKISKFKKPIITNDFMSKSTNELESALMHKRKITDDINPELKPRTITINLNELEQEKDEFVDISYFDGIDFYNLILGVYYKGRNDDVMKEAQKYFKEKNINIDFSSFDYVHSYIGFDTPFEIKCADMCNEETKKELESDGFIFSEEENEIWKEHCY